MNSAATFLPAKIYDATKIVVMYVLPALATLVLTVGEIWGLPKVQEVAATITALNFFLGAVVGISHNQYQKSGAWADGDMTVQYEDGVPVGMSADLNNVENPMDLSKQKAVTFRVVDDMQV